VAKFALAPVKAESGKPSRSSSLGDAVSALTNLGYKQAEAFTVVNKALNEGVDDDVQTLIRLGLKELAK
jgi:Holliday junction DNA helicase RuvA